MPAPKDLSGQTFNRLEAVRRHSTKSGYWWFVCTCGEIHLAKGTHVTRGDIRSCGCLANELLAERTKKNCTTHGMTKSKEYKSYWGAKQRCNNPKSRGYQNYGGRGIKFLFESFEQFYSILGRRPKGKTLERPDVNGHYSPQNVSWATHKIQAQNQRRWLLKPKVSRETIINYRALGYTYDQIAITTGLSKTGVWLIAHHEQV